jgi:hypothetical protein
MLKAKNVGEEQILAYCGGGGGGKIMFFFTRTETPPEFRPKLCPHRRILRWTVGIAMW